MCSVFKYQLIVLSNTSLDKWCFFHPLTLTYTHTLSPCLLVSSSTSVTIIKYALWLTQSDTNDTDDDNWQQGRDQLWDMSEQWNR